MAVKRAKKTYNVSLMDLVILLANLHIASQDEEIGYNEAATPLKRLNSGIVRQAQRFPISEAHLESCLYSCNMLDEKGKFWTPWLSRTHLPFTEFVKRILHKDEKFNRTYNWIEKRK